MTSAAAVLHDVTHRAPPGKAAPLSSIEASQGETEQHSEPPDADGVAVGRSTGSSVFEMSVGILRLV